MHIRMSVRIRRTICGIVIILSALYLYTNRVLYANIRDKDVSLKLLLAAAIRAAEIGGSAVVAVHDQVKFEIQSKGKTKEGINDPVTEADYKSHCAMYHSLLEVFPSITVISEETSKNCDKVTIPTIKDSTNNLNNYDIKDEIINADDITVWIDPLDATKEFTENLLQYVTTMVCVAVKGKPIMGVIYKPFETKQNSSLFWTWTNHAVSRNLQVLHKLEDERAPILIVSRSHAGQIHNASKIAFGTDVKIISAAGAGYKFLEVVSGNATAYVHMTAIKKWDICAGIAILTALGGMVTQLFDQQLITFGPNDSTELTWGLLATMSSHTWYLDKFSNM
ncbi:putative inositol monophosphatase 3 [Ceratina calcarata]|uniref:inositol-phosphate phosphatase n=1 Tax=Ceratina calcarata TaxID=156304 RepID=A0AAJ7J8V6_9HYME|nr:putative inositol monophosphatase 3 [Ceratina calcarata]XP_017887669.1 putative inositol monophosphatase 3 [Ceratina calcarata]XP_017887670.1 putative inositol monophosphatase 3 [Ceratina calcarata]XP_026673051.1 putative inositol monophosphatase 3 [Ceratina calcarata]